MAGVLIVWAQLPEAARDWYENEYLPDMRQQFAIHTLHCEITSVGLENEPVGKLDAPWPLCALYEVDDAAEAKRKCYDPRNHPPPSLFNEQAAQYCFDVRTYRELQSWLSEEWDGRDVSRIASLTCCEWNVPIDQKDDVYKWYTETVIPLLMESPDVLRARVLEVDHAIVQRGKDFVIAETETLHTFLTLVEMESEDWPWDVVLEVVEDENWLKYFENQDVVKWNVSSYLLLRAYTEKDKPRSAMVQTKTESVPTNTTK